MRTDTASRHESDRPTNQTRVLHGVDGAVMCSGVARGGQGRGRGGTSGGEAVMAMVVWCVV